MTPKNTICLWFDKDAQDAARFYAATFPGSQATAIHKAPADDDQPPILTDNPRLTRAVQASSAASA
jgi:predicted 3-demethylubiquinone-9 3-methyltransferase (glyoxalase superfamily)